jgi:hypothetical protein
MFMEMVFQVWFAVAILPFIMFLEGSEKLADFLKKKNIYQDWDVWHSSLVVLIFLAIIVWTLGFR